MAEVFCTHCCPGGCLFLYLCKDDWWNCRCPRDPQHIPNLPKDKHGDENTGRRGTTVHESSSNLCPPTSLEIMPTGIIQLHRILTYEKRNMANPRMSTTTQYPLFLEHFGERNLEIPRDTGVVRFKDALLIMLNLVLGASSLQHYFPMPQSPMLSYWSLLSTRIVCVTDGTLYWDTCIHTQRGVCVCSGLTLK